MTKNPAANHTVANELTLPEPVARRQITEAQWRTLANNLYPGARSESILMVVDYCRARKLDPLKKPCHIVPMSIRNGKTGEYEMRDVVLPGIYEYRTTAQRTGEYLGHSSPTYGNEIEHLNVSAPAWCELTVYRWNGAAGTRVEFPVRVYFREIAATTKDRKTGEARINDRWTKAPIQMLTKCTEAAALREAFPDELGGEHTVDEMVGREIDDPSGPVGKPDVRMPTPKVFLEGEFTETAPGHPVGTNNATDTAYHDFIAEMDRAEQAKIEKEKTEKPDAQS